jgi:hypothetical protein
MTTTETQPNRPPPRLPFLDATPGCAAHDFLVLNQRPDLTAGSLPPPHWTASQENAYAA